MRLGRGALIRALLGIPDTAVPVGGLPRPSGIGTLIGQQAARDSGGPLSLNPDHYRRGVVGVAENGNLLTNYGTGVLGQDSLIDAVRAKARGAPGTPILDNLRQNKRALSAFGVGLLAGDDWPSGLAMGISGASEAREKAKRQQTVTAALKAAVDAKRLTPELAATLANDLDAAVKYLAETGQQLDPKRYEVDGALVDESGNVVYQAPEKPTTTDDIREYQFARQQGYEGTLSDYQLALRRAGTPGRFGPIPAGMQLQEGPDGLARLVEIPGGPAEQDREQAAVKAASARESELGTANIVKEDLGRARDLIEANPRATTGAVGAVAGLVPGTPAYRVQSLLDTVKANIGFQELQRMRLESPTGGGLGQITVREIEFLQAVAGNLDRGQGKDQLIENINRLEAATDAVINRGLDNLSPEEIRELGGGAGARAPAGRARILRVD